MFLKNFALALISWSAISLGQWIYHLSDPSLAPSLPTEKYVVLFIILLLFSFAKNRVIRFLALSFIPIFSFFQWTHISYYGTRLFPHEIWLAFTQAGEITGALKEELFHVWLPLLLTMPAVVLIYWLNNRWHEQMRKLPLVSFLFVFYFVYNPARTFVTNNTWGRQPSIQEFDGVNTYLSLSYFLGRILPGKLFADEKQASLEISKIKGTPEKMNILFVLGESLTPNHMSLYGYQRDTTPYLKSIANDPNFIFTKALSSGVSSDIAVAMFFNNTYGLGGTKYIYSGENCLFNLAKEQGFHTKFYSAQSAQQLRYINSSICPKYIEDLKSLDDLDPNIEDTNAADDLILVEELKKMDMGSKKNQFVVLHMRGTHAPFNMRYPAEFGKFVPKDAPSSKRVGHYDNGVAYFDHFFKELLSVVKEFETPTLVLYVSDHGEGLGEEGVWGHGSLNLISATTPYMIYKHNLDNLELSIPQLPTHLNVSLLISKTLGYEFNIKHDEEFKNYEILGNDIDGFAGKLLLKIDSGKVTEKKTLQ